MLIYTNYEQFMISREGILSAENQLIRSVVSMFLYSLVCDRQTDVTVYTAL